MPLSEIETLLKQVISPKATALFVTPDRDLPVVICHITQASRVDIECSYEKDRTYNYKDNRVTDNRLKMNFELTSFLDGDIETAVQSCAEMEQKELLEELAESVGAATG
ncbi:hypothetical protein Sjap_018435 [Stephania japonica]|uniref:Uncharacterized protein n=1 Tax=Stephania japonica TaxID=461633 RepID=A0AAP0I818_9MAGN